jgi:hypothetical protein
VYVTFSREPMPGSTDEPLTVWPLPPSLRELLPSRAALYANRERLTGRKGNASGG